jgi:nitrate reductase gamma subunit
MDNFSPYELAQQRFKQRERRETHTLVWLWLAAICVLLAFFAGSWVLLLVILTILFAMYSAIEWYFASRNWTPPLSQVKQEMEWLFGDSWQTAAGVYEFSMAFQRIDNRRMAQTKIAFHLGLFLVANVFIFGLIVYNLENFNTPGPAWALTVPIVWLAVLVYQVAVEK